MGAHDFGLHLRSSPHFQRWRGGECQHDGWFQPMEEASPGTIAGLARDGKRAWLEA